MKPLTIKQLKALEVGDWVWVVDNDNKFYVCKEEKCAVQLYGKNPDDEFAYATAYEFGAFDYSEYGKTWLAYKNKEQAEAKGEIVELPCKRKLKYENLDSWQVIYSGDRDFVSVDLVYSEQEAERRLAELKGE